MKSILVPDLTISYSLTRYPLPVSQASSNFIFLGNDRLDWTLHQQNVSKFSIYQSFKVSVSLKPPNIKRCFSLTIALEWKLRGQGISPF